MFEGIIANLLNKYLGDFIDGIDASQLKISAFSGDVELFNLSVRKDIWDNLPLPFKIMYGKVGRIFVDVPVTGLLSSPLKIEISEVFVVVRPKRYEEFNREAIEKTFIESTQSTLDKLEEYYKSKLEIIKSESSVVNAIINRLIDNIQVDVQNICIRFEDDVSNPKMPYAIGITLQAFQLYTWNKKFEKKSTSGNTKSYKTAKITKFQIYLNFAKIVDRKRRKIHFEEIAKIDSLDKIENEAIRDLIINRSEKKGTPSAELIRTKNFLLEEIDGFRDNRYIIENFCIEIRLIYNKNPKKNKDPMVTASIVFGGQFKKDSENLLTDADGTSSFKLDRQQMTSILKFLDFSQKYTEFQTGVQGKFIDRKFTPKEKSNYMKVYEEYKQSDKNKKKSDSLREDLGKFLSHYLV